MGMSDTSQTDTSLQQWLDFPVEVGTLEMTLIKDSAVRSFDKFPSEEPAQVRAAGDGCEVSFPSGCVLHIEMAASCGLIRVGRVEIRSCDVDEPFIIMLRIRLANREEPYFLIPSVLYGTNNASREPTNTFVDAHGEGDVQGYGGDPQLTYRSGKVWLDRRRSPGWHFRADRSAAPFVSATFAGHFVALGIREVTQLNCDTWAYNGLGVWTDAEHGDWITVTLGSLDWPARLIAHELGDAPLLEPLTSATAVGMKTEFVVSFAPTSDRFAYEPVLEAWYEHLREKPRPGASLEQAMRDVGTALIQDGVDPASGYFHMYRNPEGIAAFSTLLAWAGVLQIARPLMRAGRMLSESTWVDTAAEMVSRAAADAYNTSSGLFNDIYFDGRWQPNNWWPTLGHTSLINGHACYLLMKMSEDDPARHDWARAVLPVVRHVANFQREDGRLPAGFSPGNGQPTSYFGFGGCFFIAPWLMAHRLSSDSIGRDGAVAALEHYWQQFSKLQWSGVDLDCRGAQDCGSSYALIRALAELHRQTGDPQALNRLGHVINYACTYRYSYNVHLRNPVCDWSSSGAKVTSTHNIHVDAYGGEILEDFQYYVTCTGDAHIRNRIEDSLAWARQAYNRTENEYGWGKVGWVTEQYYHTYDHYHHPEADGTVWISYFPWAAGSLLNAFVLEAERAW
jgi:hypothetical protein